jgi:hypothetical protein
MKTMLDWWLLFRLTRGRMRSLLEERNYYLFALSVVHELALLRKDIVTSGFMQAALKGETLGGLPGFHRQFFPSPSLGLGLLGERGFDEWARAECQRTGQPVFNAEAAARKYVQQTAMDLYTGGPHF